MMKLPRDIRLIMADYIARHCGLGNQEADLAEIVRDPDTAWLRRFHGGKAAERRVRSAMALLQSASPTPTEATDAHD